MIRNDKPTNKHDIENQEKIPTELNKIVKIYFAK